MRPSAALTVWRWGRNNRRRRVDVALLNAGFTVGALLGPALVAASLRYGGGRWAFYAISGGAFVACFQLGSQPPLGLPVSNVSSFNASWLPRGLHARPSRQLSASFSLARRISSCASTQVSPTDKRGELQEGACSGSERSQRMPRLLQRHSDSFRTLERRSRARYEASFIAAMSIVLCCVTGCEHGLATWLSPYGVEQGGLSEQRMAFMSSTYWGVMCAGRILWAAISGIVSSTCAIPAQAFSCSRASRIESSPRSARPIRAKRPHGALGRSWPMLFFDVISCLASALLLLLCRVVGASSRLFEPILWTSAMGLGLGVASGLPCVYSLPPEAQVRDPTAQASAPPSVQHAPNCPTRDGRCR